MLGKSIKKIESKTEEARLREVIAELSEINQKRKEELIEIDRIAKMLIRRDFELTEIRRKREEELKESRESAKDLERARVALMNILEDVDEERKTAERERDKTLAIIDNFADGLIGVEDEMISLVNPKAKDFFQLQEEDIIFRRFEEIVAHPKVGKLAEMIEKEKGPFFRKEFIASDFLTLEVSRICIQKTPQCGRAIIILHDVTREKEIEKIKSEFVSIAAHQLRTPLSAVKWILSMFLTGDLGSLAENQKEFLNKAQQSNERMIGLVNDLLNTTRIEEGKFLGKVVKSDLSEVLKEILLPFEELAKNKNLRFIYEMPQEKVSQPEIDVGKIRLAFENLLDNAFHYTKEGEIKAILRFDSEKQGFVFSVFDTGMGISENDHGRIFGKFFRSSAAVKTETEGSGLGLFIAKNIIEAHGGKIWFESTEGKGSAFHFFLPLKKTD